METKVKRHFQGDPASLIGVLGLIAVGDPGEVERRLGARPLLAERVSAITALLDRGWKPRHRPEGSGREDGRG